MWFLDAREIGKSGHASQLNSFAHGFRFNYALVIILLLHICDFIAVAADDTYCDDQTHIIIVVV